ncbi:MAG: T9SS type A sorting domain-containing protein [Chitinophagales bacterium]
MRKYFFILLATVMVAQHAFAQKNYTINWQNKTRKYIVYLPRNYATSENLPLVINMHGFLTTAQFEMDYTQFNKTADTARCIVIYPEGVDLRWNSGTFFFVTSTVDDVGFLGDLMDRAAVLYNADMKKVYCTGYSAGGFMSYKMACDATNRVAAIAPNVASMVFDNLSSCVPARPIHIAAFNGTADPITAYVGFPGNFPSIDSVKHFWQIKNGCAAAATIDTLPDLRNDGTRVVRYTYNNCAQAAEQVYYKVINGGHVWPGANDIFLGLLGKTTQDISMNTIAWNFFKTKEVPQNVRCDAPANLVSTAITVDSFQLNWNAVAGVPKYKIALADDSDKVTFFETSNTTFDVKLNPAKRYRWNVASLCSTSYHNWNTTRNLNAVATAVINRKTEKITLFPNPCTTFLQLDQQIIQQQKTIITIYNAVGQIIKVLNALPNDNNIDVSDIPNGWYQLTITTATTNYTSSFIKE